MKLYSKYFRLFLVIVCFTSIQCKDEGFWETPKQPEQSEKPVEWKLFWSDEFDVDGSINEDNWTYEVGHQRNWETQYYRKENLRCKDGLLIIEAKRERVRNEFYKAGSTDWKYKNQYAYYTSASIHTTGKMEFLYGRLEIRAKIPTSSGAWPAIWTLGTTNYGWPSCGEIDILEFYQRGGVPYIHANFAWGNDNIWDRWDPIWKGDKVAFSEFLSMDPDWASKFHVWRMDWDTTFIRIYVDDLLLNEVAMVDVKNGRWGDYTNPFRSHHKILLNLALGSNGGVIDNAALPIRYEVDYVRLYKRDIMNE